MAVAAAVALAALAEPAASAALSGSAGNAASSSSASIAACKGGTLLAPVSARRLPAGALAFKYKMPDGTSFENIAPPAGFNPATASNKLLAELNLPLRPKAAAAAAMRDWKAQVAPFTKSRIRRSEKFCEAARAMPEPPVPATGRPAGGVMLPALHTSSTTMAGYTLSTGPYYQRVVGHFTQPHTDDLNRSMSSWIGLSGDGSGGRLAQAGSGNEIGSDGGSPFWELYCSGGSANGCNTAVIDYSDIATPGEDVSMNVGINPSALTSTYQVAIGGALVINTPYPLKSSNGVSDSVAYFITERTGGTQIPVFTTIPFTSSRTYASYNSSASVPFGSQSGTANEMTADGKFYTPPCSNNSNILVYPNDVTSGGFVNNFCRIGP